MIESAKGRFLRYFLMILIAGFFVIPAFTLCFFDCKFFAPKKIASILLFFFR